MNSTDIVLQILDLLDALRVPYMLVGSFSSNFYGRPRSTKDADFVVEIQDDQLSRLAEQLGFTFKLDRQMSFETVTMTSRYVITHPATAFKVELFLLSPDAHDQSRFARRVREDFEGRKASLPTAEDVVITKLRWSRGGNRRKDVDDVREVLAIHHRSLDLPYVRHWCDQHGTRELFEKMLADVEAFDRDHPVSR